MTTPSAGHVGAVLVAAGSGSRIGGVRKQFREVGGIPLLSWAIGFLVGGGVDRLVVVAPPDAVPDTAAVVAASAASRSAVPVQVVPGGATLQASVAAGLAALPDDVDVVVVHDAARAFCPSEVVSAVVARVRSGAAAVIPVLPVTDTLAPAIDDDTLGRPVDRSVLRIVQTPQGFDRAVLLAAHAAAPDDSATDDAGLVAALGHPVVAVAGAAEAFKVTTAVDLLTADALAARLLEAVRR